MTDKALVLELPEELLDRAQAAHLDLRQLLISPVEQNLPNADSETLQILERRLSADQVSMALESLAQEKRILGLYAGLMEIGDDFDAPLPDEFWFGSYPLSGR